MAASSMSATATILPILITASLTMSHLSSLVSANNRLNPGEQLLTFSSLTYESQYRLEMQKYCNLVFTNLSQNKEIWESGTKGKGIFCTLTMQSDGNLVIYSQSGTAVWASNTGMQSSINNYYLEVTESVAIRDDQNDIIWLNGNKGWPLI